MNLDEVDLQILDILKTNARTPFTEVARALGISDATVHVRVNKMLDEGVIKKYTVVVDEEALGKKVRSLVLMNVNPGHIEEVAQQLIKNNGVETVYEVHGPNDLVVKVGAEDLDELRELMLNLREIPNVATSEIVTIFKVWKETNV